ncbi:OprD family outer membrane porin [Pseudomonas sp. M30-35]|uniref:OprD family outer membrane porin n=1 Tax=Pseudomonas sp. M30-35 TaxID=1981174 RepID=UPI000B3C276D|nr:OprD family outer membrane porin [Pseudomonas sp. M30-35]ARU87236.1 hypothetical protein B9K09_04215 [Pseudomonas sp. M30-35]
MCTHKNNYMLCPVAILSAGLSLPTLAAAADGQTLELKTRAIYFDRDYESDSNDRNQGGLGLQLNYESAYLADIVGVGLSGYSVTKLEASGRNSSDVLSVDNDGDFEDSFGKLGQAFLKLKYQGIASGKIGRQLHKSLLLSSSNSRAIPNTYSGASFDLKPFNGLTLYGAWYDKWSSRSDSSFVGFQTDTSSKGAINALENYGASYLNGPFNLNIEYLRAQEFLNKTGVVASYTFKLANASNLKLTAAMHTSKDDGKLFVTGAESAEYDDEDEAGAVVGQTRSQNDGKGVYLAADWVFSNIELGGAITKFSDAWIEDNYAGDHGTNPFPTAGVLADFSNRDEKVWMLKAGYKWDQLAKGLKTVVSYKSGSDARNSANTSLGKADESELAFDLSYQIPAVKGLAFRYIFLDYNSDKTGRLDGVKEDQTDHRLYLDYTFSFL